MAATKRLAKVRIILLPLCVEKFLFTVPFSFFLLLSLSLPLQELDDIRKSGQKVFRNIAVDESNILKWQGLIVPVSRTLRTKPHPLQLVTGGVASLRSCDLIVHLYLFVTSSWVLHNIRRYFCTCTCTVMGVV